MILELNQKQQEINYCMLKPSNTHTQPDNGKQARYMYLPHKEQQKT